MKIPGIPEDGGPWIGTTDSPPHEGDFAGESTEPLDANSAPQPFTQLVPPPNLLQVEPPRPSGARPNQRAPINASGLAS
jgi:hypothetical protein